MLTIKKLTKTLGGRTLLREAEMSINWGERVALVGPNGAGKSTLFRMILDEDSPDEGTIERDEYAITGYLAQESGEPTDETIIEIAMGITPEMIGILLEYIAKAKPGAKIALVNSDTEFGRDPIAPTEKRAAELGLKIVEKIATPPTSAAIN